MLRNFSDWHVIPARLVIRTKLVLGIGIAQIVFHMPDQNEFGKVPYLHGSLMLPGIALRIASRKRPERAGLKRI